MVEKYKNNNWTYGYIMYKDGNIKSADEWDDDKEKYLSIMDRDFDYLWWLKGNKIKFIDRLYSDNIVDDLVLKKKEINALELEFDNFAQVDEWIKKYNEL